MKTLITLLALMLSGAGQASTTWMKPATQQISCGDYFNEIVGANVYNNNVWNKTAAGSDSWTQCLERQPGTSQIGWSWNWPRGQRVIFGYPQVKQGRSPWAPLPYVQSALPISHEKVGSLRVSHELDISTDGDHNVATSMWLTSSDQLADKARPEVIVAELMIWTYSTRGHMTPAGRHTGDIEFDGQQWEVWVDKNWSDMSGANKNRWIYLTFRAKQSSLKASFDVAQMTRYAIERNILPSNFYYADVELGTEIMSGSGLAWVKSFDVNVRAKQ